MQPDAVLSFWFHGDEVRKAWFEKDPAFDAEIRTLFRGLWDRARAQTLEAWRDSRDGCLAYVVLCDQFPRNMFRGEAHAFATDPLALGAARSMVERGWHLELPVVCRTFAYLPFEHSESLLDQEKALALYQGHPNHEWAVKHWEIVKRFGRFPHRNAALGRLSTSEEVEFLKQPGSAF